MTSQTCLPCHGTGRTGPDGRMPCPHRGGRGAVSAAARTHGERMRERLSRGARRGAVPGLWGARPPSSRTGGYRAGVPGVARRTSGGVPLGGGVDYFNVPLDFGYSRIIPASLAQHLSQHFPLHLSHLSTDIDETPVYPAALALDNLLTVTSSDASERPARGSNRGRESVDLAVPAEEIPVTGFDDRVRSVSGSSYAAARVSALAVCLLAAHPEWTVPELRSAILDRAEKPVSNTVAYVGAGTLRDPTATRRGACEAEPAAVAEIPLGA